MSDTLAGIDPETTLRDLYFKRPISHDEAKQIAERFINSRFGREPGAHIARSTKEKPYDPDDDDILLTAYIMQQRAKTELAEATKRNNQRRLTQDAVFLDWCDLPAPIRDTLDELEDFIGDIDGKETVISTGENTFIDDGTVDASDAVNAINRLVAILRDLSRAKEQV
jgi:hypothetical protein